ncbi:hypothetical protein PP175_28665 (plasmid) [Aneurinibacillus sp. Ricciae_BoGa-3]|uniref:hypothetical protein n=1 Tax=Aneurinibacillus sp. Ricciae_BoGa-3 TaxID=3022697 RepID=UPI002340EE80|nr:hypothetical protein [Aneurinibacillus sp. Ricciae_BoGa-3]WCK57163.1 hypothetical protein PP175_28665 [Aneurinibacillus sp. Ricciae_BoGa-3]
MYKEWLHSITRQIMQYGNDRETDLVLLHNHLSMLATDIQQNPKFQEQLAKCHDSNQHKAI